MKPLVSRAGLLALLAMGLVPVAAVAQTEPPGLRLPEEVNFLYLMANTEWIETQEELEDLITVEDTKSRKLGRWIRKVL